MDQGFPSQGYCSGLQDWTNKWRTADPVILPRYYVEFRQDIWGTENKIKWTEETDGKITEPPYQKQGTWWKIRRGGKLGQELFTDNGKGLLTLTTVHKSKGLEWDRVHIEDDYQFKLNDKDYKISDEELRLLYVACTRAKVSLNIHHIYDLMQHLKRQMPKSLAQAVS